MLPKQFNCQRLPASCKFEIGSSSQDWQWSKFQKPYSFTNYTDNLLRAIILKQCGTCRKMNPLQLISISSSMAALVILQHILSDWLLNASFSLWQSPQDFSLANSDTNRIYGKKSTGGRRAQFFIVHEAIPRLWKVKEVVSTLCFNFLSDQSLLKMKYGELG